MLSKTIIVNDQNQNYINSFKFEKEIKSETKHVSHKKISISKKLIDDKSDCGSDLDIESDNSRKSTETYDDTYLLDEECRKSTNKSIE